MIFLLFCRCGGLFVLRRSVGVCVVAAEWICGLFVLFFIVICVDFFYSMLTLLISFIFFFLLFFFFFSICLT